MTTVVTLTINNEPHPKPLLVYSLDTEQTIRDRVAYMAKSLPEYIFIAQTIPEALETKLITAFNLWESHKIENTPLATLVHVWHQLFSIQFILSLYLNYRDPQAIELELLILETSAPELAPYLRSKEFNDKVRYGTDPYQRKQFQYALMERFNAFKETQRDIFKTVKKMSSLTADVLMEDNNTAVTIEGFIEADDGILGLFDRLVVNPNFPIINYGKYYKILTNYVPQTGVSPYTNRIRIVSVVGADKFECTIEKTDENMYQFVARDITVPEDVYRGLINTLVPISYERAHVSTVYKSPKLINTFILADLLMTNKSFEMFLMMNDKYPVDTAYGTREFYFKNPFVADSPIVPVRMTHTPTETRFTIDTLDEEAIRVVSELVAKLFHTYSLRAREIESFYNAFNIDLGIEHQIEEEQLIRAEKVDVFGGLFSKKCQPIQRHPTVISSEEKRGITDLDATILQRLETRMKQPKGGETHPKYIKPLTHSAELFAKYTNITPIQFPRDADAHLAEQEWYICNHPEFPFPGLVENESVPWKFQPCCFRTDQSAMLEKYYGNAEEKGDAPVTSSYMIKTDKIITAGLVGVFSEKTRNMENYITTCLNYAMRGSGEHIMRFGVAHTVNSFLACVLTALGRSTANLALERVRLLDGIDPHFLKQEMYDANPRDIEAYIHSSEFLDPLRTVRLLEYVYKCNILLFVRNNEHPQGVISLPRHVRGHYAWKRDDDLPSIFIYTHIGSDSDALQSPHCELIIHAPDDITSYSKVLSYREGFTFTPNDHAYAFCWDVFTKLGYEEQCRNTCDIFPFDVSTISGQWIDAFGKTRVVIGNINGKQVALQTPPFPPMNVPIVEPRDYITDSVGTVEYAMHHLEFYTITNGAYSAYATNEKLARYLSSWILFLFSKYLNARNAIPDVTHVDAFIQEHTLVLPDHVYKVNLIGPRFVLADAQTLLRGDRVICDSYETRNALAFTLQHDIIRIPDRVAQFHTETVMGNYYASVNDFTRHAMEKIFVYDQTTSTNFLTWIKSPDAFPVVGFPVDKTDYFMKTPSIERGNTVSVNRVDGLDTLDTAKAPYILYVPQANGVVEKFLVHGRNTAKFATEHILAAKFGDVMSYSKLNVA